jgi:hypothetical protein
VLMPSSTLGQAVEIIDRLRLVTPLAQTFSAGVALWHGAETSDQLVARADKALYRAKQAGRNQVLAAEPAPVGGGDRPECRPDGAPGCGRPTLLVIFDHHQISSGNVAVDVPLLHDRVLADRAAPVR